MVFFIYALSFLSLLEAEASDFIKYRVKQNDTLSGILYQLNIGPIYGKKGYQESSVLKNGLPYNGNKLKIGDELLIPTTRVSRALAARENAVQTSDDKDQYQSLVLSSSISRLDFASSSDDFFQHSDLKVSSRPVPGIGLNYNVHWDSNWIISAYGQLSQVSFYQSDVVKYESLKFTRKNFGLSLGYQTAASTWSLSAGYQDHFYFSFPTMLTVNTEVIALPETQLSFRTKLKEYKKMSIKMGIAAGAILPQNSSALKSRLGYSSGLEFLVGTKTSNLKFFVNRSQASAKANRTDTTEFGIGYVFEGVFYE